MRPRSDRSLPRTPPAQRRTRRAASTGSTGRRLAALLGTAGLLAAGALGCSSSGGSRDPAEVMTSTTLELRVETGLGLQGLQLELTHPADIVLGEATPLGPFVGAECASSSGAGTTRAACVLTATFDAPATVWELRFDHSVATPVRTNLSAPTCIASNEFGSSFPVACSLL